MRTTKLLFTYIKNTFPSGFLTFNYFLYIGIWFCLHIDQTFVQGTGDDKSGDTVVSGDDILIFHRGMSFNSR